MLLLLTTTTTTTTILSNTDTNKIYFNTKYRGVGRIRGSMAPFTMHTLLEGHDECSEEENRIIATSVLAYINETKRFST